MLSNDTTTCGIATAPYRGNMQKHRSCTVLASEAGEKGATPLSSRVQHWIKNSVTLVGDSPQLGLGSVLWHSWLVDKKVIHPIRNLLHLHGFSSIIFWNNWSKKLWSATSEPKLTWKTTIKMGHRGEGTFFLLNYLSFSPFILPSITLTERIRCFWCLIFCWYCRWCITQSVSITINSNSIIRMHHSTTYADAAYCYQPSSVVRRSVCLSVCLSHQWALQKTAAPTDMPFGLRTPVGPRNHALDGRYRYPYGKGQFSGERGVPYGHSAVICAKMAEQIQMAFGLWARMGRRNHLLDGGPEVLRDVAMATNFGTNIADNCLCVDDCD